MGASVFAQDFQMGSASVDEGIGAPADDKALFAPYQLKGFLLIGHDTIPLEVETQLRRLHSRGGFGF